MGQRCEECWATSILVTAAGVPPLALTWRMGEIGPDENIMVPGPHDPPRPRGASQMTVGESPVKSTVFTLASAKKPSERLSGDQKGKIASSVPESERASSEFIGRTQI